MFTSFSTALSALNATSTAVDVVGNNLANLNTPGFKTNVVYFRDLVTQSLGAGLGETQVGFGTGRPLTIRQFTQGAIQSSTGLLDAAVQGDGFFVAKNAQGNTVYTRAGNFQVDDAGNLKTNTGETVQGWTTMDPTTGTLDTNGAIGDIVVPVGAAKQPIASTQFTMDLNLNSAAAADSTVRLLRHDQGLRQPGRVARADGPFPEDGSQRVVVQRNDTRRRYLGRARPGLRPMTRELRDTLTFGADGQLTSPAAGSSIGFDVAGLSQRGGGHAPRLEPADRRRGRAHHAVRPAFGALGEFPERVGGGAVDPRRPGRRRERCWRSIPTASRWWWDRWRWPACAIRNR